MGVRAFLEALEFGFGEEHLNKRKRAAEAHCETPKKSPSLQAGFPCKLSRSSRIVKQPCINSARARTAHTPFMLCKNTAVEILWTSSKTGQEIPLLSPKTRFSGLRAIVWGSIHPLLSLHARTSQTILSSLHKRPVTVPPYKQNACEEKTRKLLPDVWPESPSTHVYINPVSYINTREVLDLEDMQRQKRKADLYARDIRERINTPSQRSTE